jgi:hypothetical protein
LGVEYSVQTIQSLEEAFKRQNTIRPRGIKRYEPGQELSYDIQGVIPARSGRIKLKIEKFVGGGYAGQVSKVRVLNLEAPEGPLAGLAPGNCYALKILIPPSGFARLFRNTLFALAYQGPFSPQVNPAAARSGALWQKFIRRGARNQLGTEEAVVDILATLIDTNLGSCGEISEWIDGRLWRYEVDDNLDGRRRRKAEDAEQQSREYLAKRDFMARLVQLMHLMGAVELARQYEWWTCKSQPNALKRLSSDPDPAAGVVAVDFRAGQAQLPFLPTCPADFKLIPKGIARGDIVQFDRGDLNKLKRFVGQNKAAFSGMEAALEELEVCEKAYRESLPDVAHHHIRLLYSRKLWASILKANIQSWRLRNIIDDRTNAKLSRNVFLTLIFTLIGLIPLLGRFIRKLWGRQDYRRHYGKLLTRFDYFQRAFKAKIAESLIRWHRAGRVNQARALRLAEHPGRFLAHFPFSLLPPGLHRFFTDKRSFLRSLDNILVRPVRLYFKTEAREEWLRDMISQGRQNGMLTDEEASRITAQIKEPFIQKYLKSLAVHVCTLPVTQIVSVIVAFVYVRLHPELSWQQASLHAGLILGLFQVTPISPGSLVRGLYVTGLVLKERNFKDYSIAFYLSFFKYIGYLAFPIQMAYRYADLARFMAGHWATGAVHIVPVFGERGALLEHAVFDMFYNFPLTIRRRLRIRREKRAGKKTRLWHVPLCMVCGWTALAAVDMIFFQLNSRIPTFGNIWWVAVWIPLLAASATTAWAGGARLPKRMLLGAACGAAIALGYALINTALGVYIFSQVEESLSFLEFLGQAGISSLWKLFLFTLLAIFSVLIAETRRLRE